MAKNLITWLEEEKKLTPLTGVWATESLTKTQDISWSSKLEQDLLGSSGLSEDKTTFTTPWGTIFDAKQQETWLKAPQVWDVSQWGLGLPDTTPKETSILEDSLQSQVDVTKKEQENLTRQRQDILDRFEWQVTLDDLQNLNKFELQDKIKEFELKESEKKEVTQKFEDEIGFQERSQERRLSLFDQKVTDLKTNFNNRLADAKIQVQLNNDNALKVAALTGSSFSSAGQEWLALIEKRGNDLISRLEAWRDSSTSQATTQREGLVDEFTRQFDSLTEQQDNALNRAKTEFLAAAFQIDAELDITTQEGLDNLIKIKDDFLDREKQIRDDAQSQITFNLDSATKAFDLMDRREDRARTTAVSEFDRFADLENLQNVTSSDIIQFAKKFPERSQEIARNLSQRQVNNTAIGIDNALEWFWVKWFSFDADVRTRIEKGLTEEGRTPNDVMREIVGELLSDPTKLAELQELGLSESEKIKREQQTLKEEEFALEKFEATGITPPSGQIGQTQYTNEFGTTKTLDLDTTALSPLQTALNKLWNTVIVADTFRTPERQKELHDSFIAWEGWLAAKPGTSKHETWLAIDIYSGEDENGQLQKLKPEQVKIMNDNWWFQTAWDDDLWHFEFKGVTTGDSSVDQSVQAIINGSLDLSQLWVDERWPVGRALDNEITKLIENETDGNRAAILKSATSTKNISDTALTKIEKIQTVAWQLWDLKEQLSNWEIDTWPLIGILKSKNPFDVQAQAIRRQLIAIVPNLARWVFGEVWVLTDADIKNYQQTVPNLTSIEEVNAATINMLEKTLERTFLNTVSNQAKAWRNMSQFKDDYDESKARADKLFNAKEEEWGVEFVPTTSWFQFDPNKWFSGQDSSDLDSIFN